MVLNYPCVEDESRGGKHWRENSRMPGPLSDPKVQESDTTASIFVNDKAPYKRIANGANMKDRLKEQKRLFDMQNR